MNTLQIRCSMNLPLFLSYSEEIGDKYKKLLNGVSCDSLSKYSNADISDDLEENAPWCLTLNDESFIAFQPNRVDAVFNNTNGESRVNYRDKIKALSTDLSEVLKSNNLESSLVEYSLIFAIDETNDFQIPHFWKSVVQDKSVPGETNRHFEFNTRFSIPGDVIMSETCINVKLEISDGQKSDKDGGLKANCLIGNLTLSVKGDKVLTADEFNKFFGGIVNVQDKIFNIYFNL